MVFKYPVDEITCFSKLVVGEGQVGVFYKGGQILKIFEPGTYTLSTDNIPLLQKLVNIPYGGKTPFTAEIYYINKTARTELYWGTKDPIQLIDPKYNIKLSIRAFGQFGFKIKDYELFLTELIGTLGPNQITNQDNITSYFRGLLISKLKSLIASEIIRNKISALELSASLDILSEVAQESVKDIFLKYGIEIINFYIESINFPEGDFEEINDILKNKASFDIIGDSRYNVMRTFDVYEKAADNSNGVAGVAASLGVGMGLASSLAQPNMSRDISAHQEDIGNKKNTMITCECGNLNSDDSTFCSNCGKKVNQKKLCNKCSFSNNIDAKFCSNCANNLVDKVCKNCNKKADNNAKFCNSCGGGIE